MTSPLGKYSQIVAAVVAVATIASFLVGSLIGLPAANLSNLEKIAFIAIGAVFGSSAATNGWKAAVNDARAQIAVLHKRLDQLNVPAARSDPRDTVIGN